MKDSGVWEGYLREIRSCAWNRKGHRIISSDRKNAVRLWDGTTGRELAVFSLPLVKAGAACAFSADLDRIAIPCKIAVLEVSGQALAAPARIELQRPDDLAGYLKDLDLDTEHLESRIQDYIRGDDTLRGPYALIDSDDVKITIESLYAIKIWDGEAGNERSTLKGYDAWVTACAFNPDGRLAASGDAKGTIRLWEVERGKEIAVLERKQQKHGAPDDGGVSSADTENLNSWLAAEDDGQKGKSHLRAVRTLVFSPDGKKLISGSDDQTLKVWDAGTREEVAVFSGHRRRVSQCAISAEGTRVISADTAGGIRIWDTTTGLEIAPLKGHYRSVEFRCSPDAKRLVTMDAAHHLRLWDAYSGSELRSFPDTSSYALGPDGKRLVLSRRDGTLTLWRTGPASQELGFESAYALWGPLAFSGDGKLVFGAGGDAVALWDVNSGSMLARLEGFGSRLRTCAFSPDGGRVVVGGATGSIQVLSLENVGGSISKAAECY